MSVAIICVIAIMLAACTGADTPSADLAPDVAAPPDASTATAESSPEPIVQPTEVPATVEAPAPTPAPTVSVTADERSAALEVEPAPLGTYVVAKLDAGVATTSPPWRAGLETREIPVYDEPFGEPRTLIYENDIDGTTSLLPLLAWSDEGAPPVVLRVVAGTTEDAWIKVQAPTRPHDRTVWVRTADFDFSFSPRRIEIDLAGGGRLRLIDGGAIILESGIVQGRSSRPTPLHVTYIDGGVASGEISPAYGSKRLSMASFSEVLATFGSGGAPRNYLHGTNQPDLMGQRVSSGEIRVPNETIDEIAAAVVPGTPVVLFDSSTLFGDVDVVASRPTEPAMTVPIEERPYDISAAAQRGFDELWVRCANPAGLICRTPALGENELLPIGSVFLIAKQGPDLPLAELPTSLMIPVYDVPGGTKRMLVYQNAIDGVDLSFPLFHQTVFGQPLVLRVLQGAPGDEWILVQAPIRPHRTSVWVRGEDFNFAQTTRRLEIDIAGEGQLTLFEGHEESLRSLIVSGRESRPTTLHDTYVEQAFEADRLSPAYGTHILTLASFSDALGTYGGGGMPGQSVHGTNQPDLVGQKVSSGGIRVSNEVITQIYEVPGGMLGASVMIFDSSKTEGSRDLAIERLRQEPWLPARTTSVPQTDTIVATPVPSYS